jgi:MoxR-like ATPase
VVDQVLLCIFQVDMLLWSSGLAKTLMVNTCKLWDLILKNQFTPDLMPSDILGSEILDENRQFKFIKGPVFSNIILADEINRTPPKTQAALLEACKNGPLPLQVIKLDLPYFVLATQNPLNRRTYPLPEAS